MIFPILSGILSFRQVPVTWLLFVMNLAVFLFTQTSSEHGQSRLESFIRDDAFAEQQGLVYAQYIAEYSPRYSGGMNYLSQRALDAKDISKRRLLGGMAMRDSRFLEEASRYPASGDQVALDWWRQRFDEVQTVREMHPSYSLGLTQENGGWNHWLTYQFAHSGGAHFFGNMIFLLIFASSLEGLIGSLGVLCVYLFSGVFAALTFTLLNESSAIPLIGASGAVSGVMALFCVLMWNRGVRYVFFLMVPKRGYAGLVYLPAWVTLILWFLSDLAGHWSTPSELGGVAYSAHLGGELCGLIFGLALLALRRARGQPMLPQADNIDTKPLFTRYV